MKYFIALVLTLGFIQNAQAKKSKAHVHGAAKLAIALEADLSGEMILEGAGEVLVGFESKPKNMKQEKALAEAQEKLKTKISEMVIAPAESQCTFELQSFDIVYDGHHSDFKTVYAVKCLGTAPQELTFQFAKVFPRMKKVSVEFLSDKVQKQIEVKGKEAKLNLAK